MNVGKRLPHSRNDIINISTIIYMIQCVSNNQRYIIQYDWAIDDRIFDHMFCSTTIVVFKFINILKTHLRVFYKRTHPLEDAHTQHNNHNEITELSQRTMIVDERRTARDATLVR